MWQRKWHQSGWHLLKHNIPSTRTANVLQLHASRKHQIKGGLKTTFLPKVVGRKHKETAERQQMSSDAVQKLRNNSLLLGAKSQQKTLYRRNLSYTLDPANPEGILCIYIISCPDRRTKVKISYLHRSLIPLTPRTLTFLSRSQLPASNYSPQNLID